MKRFLQSHTLSTGLAIFSMFFGAGNLMYPIVVGIQSGTQNIFGMAGFLITAVCLPLAGLVGMVLFDENYKAFFNRLGNKAGSIVIAISLIIIGPLVAIPRIATLSHTMIAPFIPIQLLQQDTAFASFLFAILFFALTFLCTYKESRIVDLLGYVISPLLLISLVTIIIKGIWSADVAPTTGITPVEAFKTNIMRGYETLDLLGAIFFSYVVLTVLKKSHSDEVNTHQKRAIMGLKAGGIGLSLLAIVYIGLSYLGVHFGPLLPAEFHAGEIFREISFIVLGARGAIVISVAVLMACLSTSIALCTVFSEYLQHDIFKGKISYIQSLLLTFALCLPLSTFGLGKVLELTGGPITFIGYPVLITLTMCNIAYKLFGFKPIKAPVAATFALATFAYYWPILTSHFGA